ncbi:MAG TPA: energy transducer TonB [Steroidobacteraceae bacterium]|nr:energy transducer TonB [Steroidobacteraceae bacterium]
MATKIPARDLRAATPLGVAALRLGLAPSPLIALTRDTQLVAILKAVSDPSHEVVPVGSEVDLSGTLLTHQGGVAVIDCAALANPIGELIDRLHAQFPELVLIVAGGSDEQGMLSTQITNGSVHRFLHRPFSEQRIRLFVEAAWRRHAQGGALPEAESRAKAPRRRRRRAAPWLLLAALALAAPVAWYAWHPPPEAPAAAPAPPAVRPSDDSALESLLARADTALAAGALVAPPQENAAELYARALGRNARDPRAVNGLARVIDQLLAAAEQELQQQHLDAAEHLTEQARAIDPNHARVAFLAAQIGAQRERAVLNKAQRAAAGGDVAGALATLEDASHGEHRSTLVEQARQQLAQKQLDGRIADYLGRAREALTRGALIAPVEDNARFYIESARALAPADIHVQQATQELIARLQNEARQALSAKNAEQADIWIAAAADAGAEPAQVGALRAEAQQLRSGVRTAELAQLSGAFNERLERGQVLDPASDSARFYLTQLSQRAPDDPLTQRAHSAYTARLLDEARAALRGQDLAGTRRWLTEARGAGADASALGTIETALRAAQDDARHAQSYVDAAALTRTHYLAPQFPDVARKRGLDGWVDLQFVVGTDGAVSDVAVVGAQPVGIFEQAALDAVRHWRYQPVLRAGQTVSQHARVRLRFTVQR